MSVAERRHALRRAVGGFLALACVMGIGRFAYTPVLPAMRAEYGLDIASAGYIASANFAGYLAGALIAGQRVFTRRREATVLVATLASVTTTAAMALVDGLAAWSIVRFASGVASALVLVCGASLFIEAIVAARRPLLNALPYAGVGAGIALSALLVHAVGQAGGSAPSMWLLLGALGLALGLPGARWLGAGGDPGRSAQAAAGLGADHGSAAAVPRAHPGALHWLTFGYGLLGLGYVVTATFIVLMVRELPNGRSYEAAVWTATGVAAIPSNLLWLAVARRWGNYRALVAAYVLEAAGVAASGLSPGLTGAFVGGVLVGGTFMAITALSLPVARALDGGGTRAIGRMTVAFSLGQILGPGMAGVMAESSGSFAGPSLLAAAALAAGAFATARAGRLAGALGPGARSDRARP